MTYPSYEDSSGQGGGAGQSASGYPDYSASGYPAQTGYGPAGYGAQSPVPAPGAQPGNGFARPGPPSNVGWAVASILCFWPLSFIAMTRALDVYPLWAAGRHAEAAAASASAKKLGIVSLAIVAVFIVLYLVFFVAMVGLASSGF